MLGLGFKEFESAKRTISGIEIVHMLKKNHLLNPKIQPTNHLSHWLLKKELV